MSVPYSPPSRKYLPIEEVARLAPNLGYQADFAKPTTTSQIEAKLERFLSIIFRSPESHESFTDRGALFKLLTLPNAPRTASVLNDSKEFDYYLHELRNGGMNGPLNYYRTSKHRHDEEALANLPANLPENLPVLFIWGTKDATATPVVIKNARKFIKKLQDIAFEGRGHWVLAEAKDEITEKVASWLQGLTSRPHRQGKL
ncbi:hypothetical protein H0H81_005890 [Sphagnurus paluster]|uniref:Uncharacterized protein n=1 Tax=Sphagnurus paluster TaxID=117069 RepID=A0A9P7FW31_9AGAR|nr:hypothetical protein H0H81_005890 [Sphagnurus paluster]